MKEQFTILHDITPENPVILLSLGERQATLLRCSAGGNELERLTRFETASWEEGDLRLLSEALSAWPGVQAPACILLEGPHVLVPAGTGAAEVSAVLSAKAGPLGDAAVCRDKPFGWQLDLQYVVHAALYKWIRQQWPGAQLLHKQTALLRASEAGSPEGCLMADLAPGTVDLLLVRQSRILLSERYRYETPADLLYQLLGVAAAFGLSREECPLRLSGFVERQSALFTELNQYFSQIQWRESHWDTGAYPSHFFTALKDACLCV